MTEFVLIGVIVGVVWFTVIVGWALWAHAAD